MFGKHSAIDIAKYVINKCSIDKKPISNLQLQKILYNLQKEFIKKGNLLFQDDIEAWQFGPVVPVVYYQYCGYGAMPIKMNYAIDIVEHDRKIIDDVVNKKRALDPWTLVEETHRRGGAWDKTYRDGLGNHDVIDVQLIRTNG